MWNFPKMVTTPEDVMLTAPLSRGAYVSSPGIDEPVTVVVEVTDVTARAR